jgi:hypothetical protein
MAKPVKKQILLPNQYLRANYWFGSRDAFIIMGAG